MQPRRPHAPGWISPAAQNYLLSLYVLREEGPWPTAGQLAEYIRRLPAGEGLGTSLPSVLGMVRRMVREGLVAVTPQKWVCLTERGSVLAEEVVRRHRLAERLVVDLLGLELCKAHEEAHRLEHGISPEVEARIRERLGHPTTCPFGRPIPGSEHQPPPGQRVTLDKAQAGTTYAVDRVPEEDQQLLCFLVEHGVLPGQEVHVVEAGHYRGVLVFRTAQAEAALGVEAASRVWLRETPSG
ncbi:MAG: metal-dependent transcriptional regulator [Chloroflexi bacterium]|nr:metal-dependent transcriptional regulator [Chloroflexota bacterium]